MQILKYPSIGSLDPSLIDVNDDPTALLPLSSSGKIIYTLYNVSIKRGSKLKVLILEELKYLSRYIKVNFYEVGKQGGARWPLVQLVLCKNTKSQRITKFQKCSNFCTKDFEKLRI